jgi:multidrug efflux pump subunit AcrB
MQERPRPSISTASCGTIICARCRRWASCGRLQPKAERSRASHAIALDIRKRLEGLPAPEHTAIKVVEVPPGPPVLSTLLAEVYGPDAQSRRDLAAKVRKAFDEVDFVVDTDDSFGQRAERLRFEIDRKRSNITASSAPSTTRSALVGGVVGFRKGRREAHRYYRNAAARP